MIHGLHLMRREPGNLPFAGYGDIPSGYSGTTGDWLYRLSVHMAGMPGFDEPFPCGEKVFLCQNLPGNLLTAAYA